MFCFEGGQNKCVRTSLLKERVSRILKGNRRYVTGGHLKRILRIAIPGKLEREHPIGPHYQLLLTCE